MIITNTVTIKPLSVNEAWQGKRFKTKAYKQYENDVLLMLPSKPKAPEGKMSLELIIGLSNMQADIDNPVKPFVDILQKKYGFNDNKIMEMTLKKVIVKKGEEFISFSFGELD